MFHLEYHWFPTLLFPSDGPRYLSHCSTPLPCCMEHVLVALVFAAICAVLYYVQLYWVSFMQCLLAFVLFHHLRCVRFQVLRTTEGDFDPTYLTIKPERSEASQASAIATIKIAAMAASRASHSPCPNQGDQHVSPRLLWLRLQPPTPLW